MKKQTNPLSHFCRCLPPKKKGSASSAKRRLRRRKTCAFGACFRLFVRKWI